MARLLFVLSLFAVRAMIAFSDKVFGSAWRSQLVAEQTRRTIEDAHGGINARLAAASWAPLAAAATLMRIPNLCANGISFWTLPLIIGAFAISIAVLMMPFKFFLGVIPSVVVLLATLGLDIAVSYVPDTQVAGLCSVGASPSPAPLKPNEGSAATSK